MDETSASNSETAPQNETEQSSPKSDTNTESRVLPSIESQPNAMDDSTKSTQDFNESKEDTTMPEIETKNELGTAPMEHESKTEQTLSTEEEEEKPPDDPDENPTELPALPESHEPEVANETSDTMQHSNDENKSIADENHNQSLIDDSEDLLVPTDYVPDSADIIGDEPKRKHPDGDEVNEICKKFKHDPLTEEDMSMQTESTEDDFDDLCAENEEMPDEPTEPPIKESIEKTSPIAHHDNTEPPEKCKRPNDDLNITDILTEGINSNKTIALADIIEGVNDFVKKDDKQSDETNNSDLKEEETKTKNDNIEQSIDQIDNANESYNDNTAEELDFNISEKLKDMGEISLAPVSKTERKPLPDFDLGDEISLEQICKKGTDGDDKRNKVTNLRKNIREVMDDNQLDASTLAAQREELERLARVQEQQRMIREMQRQVALDRQNSKTQSKVLSLLTGHASLLKSSNAASSSKVQATSPTISGGDVDDILSGKSGNLTPSVSIAPIKSTQKKFESIDISDVSSAIELPTETDTDSSEKLDKSDDLLIVEEDEEHTDDEDDDVIELKPKKDIVTIDDSSDDDCIM